jgi:hypothetical protein
VSPCGLSGLVGTASMSAPGYLEETLVLPTAQKLRNDPDTSVKRELFYFQLHP